MVYVFWQWKFSSHNSRRPLPSLLHRSPQNHRPGRRPHPPTWFLRPHRPGSGSRDLLRSRIPTFQFSSFTDCLGSTHQTTPPSIHTHKDILAHTYTCMHTQTHSHSFAHAHCKVVWVSTAIFDCFFSRFNIPCTCFFIINIFKYWQRNMQQESCRARQFSVIQTPILYPKFCAQSSPPLVFSSKFNTHIHSAFCEIISSHDRFEAVPIFVKISNPFSPAPVPYIIASSPTGCGSPSVISAVRSGFFSSLSRDLGKTSVHYQSFGCGWWSSQSVPWLVITQRGSTPSLINLRFWSSILS